MYVWDCLADQRVLIGLLILFNLLVSLGFVVSNIYVWNFLQTEVNVGGNGKPFIEQIGAFQISIGHPYINDAVNLGPLPTVIINYPFIFFGYQFLEICFSLC